MLNIHSNIHCSPCSDLSSFVVHLKVNFKLESFTASLSLMFAHTCTYMYLYTKHVVNNVGMRLCCWLLLSYMYMYIGLCLSLYMYTMYLYCTVYVCNFISSIHLKQVSLDKCDICQTVVSFLKHFVDSNSTEVRFHIISSFACYISWQ